MSRETHVVDIMIVVVVVVVVIVIIVLVVVVDVIIRKGIEIRCVSSTVSTVIHITEDISVIGKIIVT